MHTCVLQHWCLGEYCITRMVFVILGFSTRVTMAVGGLFMTLPKKLSNLYLCMFCFAVSLWGVIMLIVLGISCKLRAVALFEDVHIEDGPQNNSTEFSLKKENVDDGYNNAAW